MRRLALIAAVCLATGVAAVAAAGSSRGAGGPYLVRAIFDDAAFAVPGEDVRIAGATIGSIKSLAVTPDKKAAVTLEIDTAAFTPFHADATCAIRPQSLIAERYIDCQPGTSRYPTLARVNRGDGAGSYVLPVARTVSPIDSDIVQNISQEPMRQRLSIILDELGTGLAARGSDLNAVIHRANPALGYTDKVFKILAAQNKVLAQLARDSDAVLAPLARSRSRIAGFVVQANTAGVASAQRAADISRSFQLLPSFLRQLRPLMVQLGSLANQGTPLMASLGQSALAVDRQFANLIPFARAARPALIALGKSAQQSQPAFLATEPLARRLKTLGTQALPAASLLDRLTASLDTTGAIENLMSVLFNGTGAANGFDSFGHYVRSEPLVGGCTSYSKTKVGGCSAHFDASSAAAAAASAPQRVAVAAPQPAGASQARPAAGQPRTTAAGGQPSVTPAASKPRAALVGLLRYLIGPGR
jgi:ABC-type transporter Mla subunit MlaD